MLSEEGGRVETEFSPTHTDNILGESEHPEMDPWLHARKRGNLHKKTGPANEQNASDSVFPQTGERGQKGPLAHIMQERIGDRVQKTKVMIRKKRQIHQGQRGIVTVKGGESHEKKTQKEGDKQKNLAKAVEGKEQLCKIHTHVAGEEDKIRSTITRFLWSATSQRN